MAVVQMATQRCHTVIAEPRRGDVDREPPTDLVDLVGPPTREHDARGELLEAISIAADRCRQELMAPPGETGDESGGAGDPAQERHDAVAGRQRAVDIEGGNERNVRHATSCQEPATGRRSAMIRDCAAVGPPPSFVP